MNSNLLEALAQQLEEEGACAFKHNGYYYNIYELEDEAGYDYDMYESMEDSEPIDSRSCENDEPKEAIIFAMQ